MNMYFIAQVLPADLNARVLNYKQMMLDKFGCKVGLKSPAHITIIPPCWIEEEREKELINDVGNICQGSSSFTLRTKDFSAFKPRTIFIDVEVNDALKQMKEAADDYFRKKDYKIKMEDRPFKPHITIATRDLHKKAFAEAWPLFADKEFNETWVATGLSLLKHNRKDWDVIYTAAFSQTAGVQGDLSMQQ
jgi:2'-5' RNA ligase